MVFNSLSQALVSLFNFTKLILIGNSSDTELKSSTSDLMEYGFQSNASFLNSTIGEDDEVRTLGNQIAFGIAFGFMALGGICGNLMVCIVIIKDPALQIKSQLSNLVILNLAITDLLTSSCVCLPAVINIGFKETPLPKFLCVFCAFANITTIVATYLILTIVSAERFIAVKWPLHYPQWVTQRRISYFLAWAWLQASATGSSLTVFNLQYVIFDYWAAICDANWAGEFGVMVWTVLWSIVDFWIPTGLIIYFNVCIVLMSREKGRAGTLKAQTSTVNTKILIAMGLVVSFYLILNCPVAIIRIVKTTGISSVPIPNWGTSVGQVLQFSASVVNPLIYGLFRKDFRIAFIKLFKGNLTFD